MALTVYTSKDNAWREYVNPLRGMTLERIVQLIEQGERGAFADLQWFYQAMERSDALIATVMMRRRAALLSCQWDVKPEESPIDTVLACEQAAFLRDQYDRVENPRAMWPFCLRRLFVDTPALAITRSKPVRPLRPRRSARP